MNGITHEPNFLLTMMGLLWYSTNLNKLKSNPPKILYNQKMRDLLREPCLLFLNFIAIFLLGSSLPFVFLSTILFADHFIDFFYPDDH